MKKQTHLIHRILSLILIFGLIPFFVFAEGGTANSVAEFYNEALGLLESASLIDSKRLEKVRDLLNQAGVYMYGAEYGMFVDVLLILSKDKPDSFDEAIGSIQRLQGHSQFMEDYRAKTKLPDLEKLVDYIKARKMEAYKDVDGAIALYETRPVLDALPRANALANAKLREEYDQALSLIEENTQLSTDKAIKLLESLGEYRDSPMKLEEARRQLTTFVTPTPMPTPTPTPAPTPNPDAEVLIMPNRSVEARVREAAGLPDGASITRGDVKRVTELDLSETDLQDISFLAEFVSLQSLTLSRNKISDIKPLANLNNLTKLVLWSNWINDIKALTDLYNLTELYLGGNQISDIKPLSDLYNLTVLYLNGNQIRDIKPLANLNNLTVLNLNWNPISGIKPLANLYNLTELDLSANQISDIKPLANLYNLTTLILWSNWISDIKPLLRLTSLTFLDIQDNPVKDYTPLNSLQDVDIIK